MSITITEKQIAERKTLQKDLEKAQATATRLERDNNMSIPHRMAQNKVNKIKKAIRIIEAEVGAQMFAQLEGEQV